MLDGETVGAAVAALVASGLRLIDYSNTIMMLVGCCLVGRKI